MGRGFVWHAHLAQPPDKGQHRGGKSGGKRGAKAVFGGGGGKGGARDWAGGKGKGKVEKVCRPLRTDNQEVDGGWSEQDASFLELAVIKANLAAERARRKTFQLEVEAASRCEQFDVAAKLVKLRRESDDKVQELKVLAGEE